MSARFTMRTLFTYIGRGVYAPMCERCGVMVPEGGKALHVKWHNDIEGDAA